MIICPRCSKENQDHYKFCLGCGAELPRAAAAAQPKSFTAPTPPAGMPAVGAPPAGSAMGSTAPPRFGGAAAVGPAPAPAWPAQAPAPAAAFGSAPTAQPPSSPAFAAPAPAAPASSPAPSASATITCPNCGSQVPRNFKFCGTCGNDMTSLQAAAPAPAAVAPPAAAPAVGGRRGSLVLIRPDGSEGDTVPLADTVTVGRESGGPFAGDSYLSPQHARFHWNGSAYTVTDLSSLNGVFLRIDREVPYELADGTIFRIGQEIIRFEQMRPGAPGPGAEELMGSPNPGFLGRILLIIGREATGNTYCIPPEGMHLGRERGDIIFPDDGYVSGLHCRLHGEGGRVFLTDVGSSNGTFVRVGGEVLLRSGQLLLVGQQLFRIEY